MLPPKKYRIVLNVILLISLVIAAVNIAWHLSSVVNYFYKPLYSAIDIQAHIKKYAPKNHQVHFRKFVNTQPEQHYLLFEKIAEAINHNGEGLENISFNEVNSDKQIRLLTPAEVIHLEDVAKVVSVFNWTAMFSGFIALLCLWCLKKGKYSLFGYKATLLVMGAVSVVLTSSVLLIGPKTFFYYLHKWIFAENQWFFYYQESLMTTLMKAPYIFGYITIAIFVLAIAVFIALLAIIRSGIKVTNRS